MFALDIPARSADDVARLVRALGAHRYIKSRLHLVHAFAFDAAAEAFGAGALEKELAEAVAWARATLGNREIDIASRDERLMRPSSEAEVAAVISAFWGGSDGRDRVHAKLEGWLAKEGLPIAESEPFDEAVEEDIHPVLIDAGWELLPLAELDPERHKGVISAFGEAIDFDVAKFEEDAAIPKIAYLHELPALGPVELLRGTDEWGDLAEAFVLWASGHPTYHDYLVRGICRSAKLSEG